MRMQTCEGLVISTRWPRRPKPVTSVQAVAPLSFSILAASALLCCMLSRAPALPSQLYGTLHTIRENPLGTPQACVYRIAKWGCPFPFF